MVALDTFLPNSIVAAEMLFSFKDDKSSSSSPKSLKFQMLDFELILEKKMKKISF